MQPSVWAIGVFGRQRIEHPLIIDATKFLARSVPQADSGGVLPVGDLGHVFWSHTRCTRTGTSSAIAARGGLSGEHVVKRDPFGTRQAGADLTDDS